jgi:predicted RecA/RadA family phage recombinase
VPDTELTGLPALTTLADGDLLPALDVSDTSQDPSGTNKKITAANVGAYIAAYLPTLEELTAIGAVAGDDVMEIVEVSGGPESLKVTVDTLAAYIETVLTTITERSSIDALATGDELEVWDLSVPGFRKVTVGTLSDYVEGQVAATGQTINPQTGATYTFALTDVNALVTSGSASAATFTLPDQAAVAWPDGARIDLLEIGAGQLTVAGDGFTINKHADDTLKLDGAGAAATLIRNGEDDWWLIGRLEATP